MADDSGPTRRGLVQASGLGLAAVALTSRAAAAASPSGQPTTVDEGGVQGGKIAFPAIHAETERPDSPPPNPDPPARRVGFAVLGLGRLALEQILPAFAECKHARPVALVSGDPDKRRAVAAQYGIAPEATCGYEDLERIRDNPAVEAVYVVTPNALHREHVVRAARAGKHVLCEKPMAASVQEASEMINACRAARRKLMIAYRCQYEVNNAELARRVRAGEFGAIQLIDAVNTQNQGDPSQWRQLRRLSGGGSLPDVGLYCLNTTRAILGEEPVEVFATIHSPEGDPRFREVESTVSFTLRFPSGAVANCASSYSAHEHRNIRVLGPDGTGEVENAFAYEGQRLRIFRRAGQAEANTELSLGRKNQFALEIDHFAQCIRSGAEPRTPGEEGLQDQVIMAAIYEAARTGRPVRLPSAPRLDAFRGPPPMKD
jgi:predicted dehydrogenase